MKKIHAFLIYLSFFLLSVWLVMSFLRTAYNFTKVFTEEKQWLFLSDEEKRIKIFGDSFVLYKFTEINTSKQANIVIISKDKKAYYLGRYFLYPRKITYASGIKEINLVEKPNYILVIGRDQKDDCRKLLENPRECFSRPIFSRGVTAELVGILYKIN